MARPIQIGDLVQLQLETRSHRYVITGFVPEGILIASPKAIAQPSLIQLVNGQHQVAGFQSPHSISFLPSDNITSASYQQSVVATGKDKRLSPLGGMTREQILASPIVGIIHSTTVEGLRSIFRLGKIDHRLSLSRQQIPIEGGFAAGYPEEATIEQSAYNQRQFPGIYSYLNTQAFFQTLSPKTARTNFIHIILSMALLQQQNWHFNLQDQYGIINNLTFSPQTLPQHIHEISRLWENPRGRMPEIIFHDAIPLYFVEGVLVNLPEQEAIVREIIGPDLPVFLRSQNLGPMLSQAKFIKGMNNFAILSHELPQYCHTGVIGDAPDVPVSPETVVTFSDFNPYTGQDLPPGIEQKERAYIWQERLNLCGITEPYSPQRETALLQQIETRMQQLYFQDSPRTPVIPDQRPPWKYLPQYYRTL
jgi:hypothetical protein